MNKGALQWNGTVEGGGGGWGAADTIIGEVKEEKLKGDGDGSDSGRSLVLSESKRVNLS